VHSSLRVFARDVTPPTSEAPLKCPLFLRLHTPPPILRARLNLSHKTWGRTLALRKTHEKPAAGREGEWTKKNYLLQLFALLGS